MQSQAITASSRPRKETCVETVELNEQTARWESFRWPFADEGKAHAWARKAKRMTKSRRFRSIVVVVRDGEHRTVGTRRTKVMVRGPHGAAHAVLDMFPALYQRVKKLLEATYVGFKTGAFPMPTGDRAKTRNALELSNEELAFARAGFAAGQTVNPRRALQPARPAGS